MPRTFQRERKKKEKRVRMHGVHIKIAVSNIKWEEIKNLT